MTWQRSVIIMVSMAMATLDLVEIVAMRFFWHAAWRTIQGPHARTTPRKAIGFMFIPLFNLYWAFVMIWGFAKDYNAFCQRYEIGRPPHRLPAGYHLAVVIMLTGLVFLRYIPLAGRSQLPQYLRYNPTIGVIYGMCFSLAMLLLLYKTARAVDRLTEEDPSEAC